VRTHRRGFLLAGLLTLSGAALAHGPWPYDCCSDRDCAEVDSRHVREDGDVVHVVVPPGEHPMWPADGRTAFVATLPRSKLRKGVTGEWGICISPTGSLLCVFPPVNGG
jgi:hypothetical protein